MALRTLLLKEFPELCGNIKSVTATSDLNILTIHSNDKFLFISHIKKPFNFLTIKDVEVFAWQEDNYNQEDHRLLIVNGQKEICYHQIEVKLTNAQNSFGYFSDRQLSKWSVKNIFHSFQELAKSFENVSSITILKFEGKEAVFLFDGKVVVSFFPSSGAHPQLMSIVDLRDDSPRHRQVLLAKDMLFSLNESGTKLFIYSFMNNSKLFEFGFSDYGLKHPNGGAVKSFAVNITFDMLIFVTENEQIYSMLLNLSSRASAHPGAPTSSTVTAFAKHFPSVKGWNSGLRRHSTASASLQPLNLNCDLHGLSLKSFSILENKLRLLYHGDSHSLVGIHVLDSDRSTVWERMPHPVFLIRSGTEEVPFPLLLFSENKIFLLLYDTEQDKLVNELMIYPSSGTVEILSSLNNWNNIHMDIEVLKLGLSNRQLYTVEFFLKTLFEGFCQLFTSESTKSWSSKIKKECILWEDILKLVLENIYKSLAESHSCQYAEQLLQVSIGIVVQMIAVIDGKTTDESCFTMAVKNALMQIFSKFLLKMRESLWDRESGSTDVSDSEENGNFSKSYNSVVLNQWGKWEKLSIEEVVQDAILNGSIPMAQSFFSCHCKDNTNSSYSRFQETADSLVLYYLRHGLMEETLSVLLNMGIDVDSKLLDLFKSTPEKDIRAIMLKKLYERDLLRDQDVQSLEFVSLIEKLYPCTSFEHARGLLDEKRMLTDDIVCAVPENDEKLAVGDFLDFSQDNSESGSYCRVVLDWLSAWDSDIKGRILAPHYLKNSSILDYFIKEGGGENEISKESVWTYLLETGNLPYLTNWIDIWLGIHPQDSDSFSCLDKWPLSEEMINLIPEKATAYVSETLLNALARHGIFCEEESESISAFLARIGKARCDINNETMFTAEKSSLSFVDLCHRIVHYCLKHELFHFLYRFLSENYNKFPVWPFCHLCSVPVLNITRAFYLWQLNHSDSQKAYDAIAGSAQLIFKLPNLSSAELLSNVPLPLSLAILLFKPQSLGESFQDLHKSPETTVQLVKEKFQTYPILYNFLFKTPEERAQPDVTVYELFKGNTVFDTSQLFGWQSANSLKSEDSQNELPHFSLKSLSEQYGLKKELTYLYYLMEGRPNYSYLKFIAQEVVLETGLSISRVRSTCRDVTDYALSNYRASDICAACVCFVELLGQDSLPLRASLTTANMLHEAEIFDGDAEYNNSIPEIGRKFKQAYANRDSASSLISELEQIILRSWNPYCTDSNGLMKDIVLWMPVMTLSHLYEVQAGNTYLYECAKQNNWLSFLVFSQIFQIPKEQVLNAASKFSNCCISYHIFHSLHRKPSLLYDVAYETQVIPAARTPTKDMRKSYFSRIGVLKGSPVSDMKKPSNQDEDSTSITSEETSSSDVDLRSFILKDLFSQLLLAHDSDSPWECLLHTSFEIKNPILALLAASYPDSRTESCFFMWLYSSLYHGDLLKKQLDSRFPEVRVTNCSTDDIESILILAVENQKILTLWQGVHLFLPDTPLPTLMGFLRSFMIYKKFDSSIENFQRQLWDYPRDNDKSSLLYSLHWIESISVSLLKEAVIACPTSYERLVLLRHFYHTKLEKSFSTNVAVPEFMKVYKMILCLKESVLDMDVRSLFLPQGHTAYINTCWDAVRKLLDSHLYEDAQTFSNAVSLPQKEMLLLQINHETHEAHKISSWSCLSYRIEFWRHVLLKLKVLPLHSTIDFLEVQCEVSEKFGEKYFLMKSIIDILKESKKSGFPEVNMYDIDKLNRKMWWWCIKAEVNGELLPEIFDVKKVHDFDVQDILSDSSTLAGSHCIEDEKEKEALCSIIGQFLNKKDVQKAFELAATFGCDWHDLKIIKKCLELAVNEVDPSAIDFSLPNNSPEVPSSKVIRSLLLWIAPNPNGIHAAQKQIIQSIEKLSQKCTSAALICHQILVDYTVAVVLQERYISIANAKDTFNTLKNILVQKLNDEHILAKSLIVVHELADKDVAEFLSSEIWKSLQELSSSNLVMIPEEKSAFSDQVIYDPVCSTQGFQLIVKLCQDPSMLGNALMNIFESQASELTHKSSDLSFSLLVDLLVCAHECFTAACNMDGISRILHSSQVLVAILGEAEKFPMMVQLLIKLGRYSEMMYVFDILKSNEKLKILFEKKMENVPNLKLALLDYLKRCPPSDGDKYFYSLANRFGMYREKAEILEMSVQKKLSQLCKKNTDIDLKDELEKALDILSEAAKSYCEADCLHQAQSCTRLAQLIALQIYFVPSGIWIIGLDESSVARFITDHDKFSQAYIVAEEYGKHHLWSQALLHNVVLRGDREYLREFQSHFGFPTSLISDVVKRFQKLPNRNDSSVRNMKLLLSLCVNVKAKYALAQELGFSDMTSELLMGEASSYLQDLMANNNLK